jgi:hypothetical protein
VSGVHKRRRKIITVGSSAGRGRTCTQQLNQIIIAGCFFISSAGVITLLPPWVVCQYSTEEAESATACGTDCGGSRTAANSRACLQL